MLLPINYGSVLECAQSFVLATEKTLNVYAYGDLKFRSGEKIASLDDLRTTDAFTDQLKEAKSLLTSLTKDTYTVSTVGVFGMAAAPGNPCIGIIENRPFVLTDCSGFINHVVSHVCGGVGAALDAKGDRKLANVYAAQASDEFFIKQNITAHDDCTVNTGPFYIARGSILAWSLKQNNDTGHVMVVAEDTVLHTTGATQYLSIIDCSDVRADGSSGVSQRTISMKPNDGKWQVSLKAHAVPDNEVEHINVLRLK
ncbi:hypothetical protein ACMG4P_07610 [Pseudovibrio denitrificans]|uniref:hypothetical protein n=1 Tax=Pseudovibrio denitrificans TaxID=258256 RepID=UPI0039BF3178